MDALAVTTLTFLPDFETWNSELEQTKTRQPSDKNTQKTKSTYCRRSTSLLRAIQMDFLCGGPMADFVLKLMAGKAKALV